MAGRVVVVTGSTSGIGAAIAALFAAQGDEVVLHGRSRERGDAVIGEIRAIAPDVRVTLFLGDLTDPAVCTGLIEAAALGRGRIDVLVNSAGTNVFAGVVAATLDDWDRALALDLRAAWLCSRAAAERMPSGGAIVNIGSNHATATLPGCFPYNVAKAGLVALTSSLAIELAPRGVRVNTVLPGYIDTPLNDAYFSTIGDAVVERTRVERLHPMGRMGRTEDVARAVRFLASNEDAGFITGTSLLVDGGRSSLLEDPR
jgi:NAD(P)-dependent dehydrogenase (short-subunit alcohol dehydrogenase family)